VRRAGIPWTTTQAPGLWAARCGRQGGRPPSATGQAEAAALAATAAQAEAAALAATEGQAEAAGFAAVTELDDDVLGVEDDELLDEDVDVEGDDVPDELDVEEDIDDDFFAPARASFR
jgi:hypothetical protein